MIKITPMCQTEPDELSQLVASKTLRLEVGKSYVNGLGEIRTIIKVDHDYDPDTGYNYFDDQDWTYLVCGIYDLHDTFCGDTSLDLMERH